MHEERIPYFTEQTEAYITREGNLIRVTFHKEKVKLSDDLEVSLLKGINPAIKREINSAEDQIIISLEVPSQYEPFSKVMEMNMLSRWQYTYNLLHLVQHHHLSRLNIIVCPSNLLVDRGLNPHFIHYGVKESIPPYKLDADVVWHELKATIASVVAPDFDFETYYYHYETIDLPETAKKIMDAVEFDELADFISEQIVQEELFEREIEQVPKQKWKRNRYSLLAAVILLIPAIIFIIYVSFFRIPEQKAYVESNHSFLQNRYSSVIDKLEGYSPERMPYVVQYQLAKSYIENESLTEEQRSNLRNLLSLQTDRRYFLYWIYVGRGEFDEAIDIAKRFEDRDLILFSLYKYRLEIQTDTSLKGKDREEKLKEIDGEIREYENEIEQEQKELEEEAIRQERESNKSEEVKGSTVEDVEGNEEDDLNLGEDKRDSDERNKRSEEKNGDNEAKESKNEENETDQRKKEDMENDGQEMNNNE